MIALLFTGNSWMKLQVLVSFTEIAQTWSILELIILKNCLIECYFSNSISKITWKGIIWFDTEYSLFKYTFTKIICTLYK